MEVENEFELLYVISSNEAFLRIFGFSFEFQYLFKFIKAMSNILSVSHVKEIVSGHRLSTGKDSGEQVWCPKGDPS